MNKGKERDKHYGNPHGETERARYKIVTWDRRGTKAPVVKKNSFEVIHILVLTSFQGRNSCVFHSDFKLNLNIGYSHPRNREKKVF